MGILELKNLVCNFQKILKEIEDGKWKGQQIWRLIEITPKNFLYFVITLHTSG